MKSMEKIRLVLVCMLAACILGGCGAKLDASAYLSAMLDVYYKDDSSAYTEMKIGTAQQASEVYEQRIDAELNSFLEVFDAYAISEGLEEELRGVIKDMFGKVRYTVDKAEKQKDGSYVVTVTYERMLIFDSLSETFDEKISDLYTEWASDLDTLPSDEEVTEQAVGIYKDCMVEALSDVQYAEPATATVKIELIDNVYTPNENDIANLGMALFDSSME